nr:MAG TPA: repressor domain protein [Caudoviricetes sp.]
MNEMMIFSNPEFGNVRTVMIDNNPWFVGIDVATALGYQNGSRDIQRHVELEDKAEVPFYDGTQTRNIIAINESGLFSLIFSSKLEKAKEFKHWVTSEVLPSIRKTGKYEVDRKIDSYQISDPIKRAERWIEEQREKQLLEQKVQEQKPKADYFDSLVDNRLLTTFRDTAKEFHMSPKALTDWLVTNKYVYRDKRNMLKPYETYRKSGLFQMKDFSTPYGFSNVQTYITVKGKETFRLLLQGQGVIPV